MILYDMMCEWRKKKRGQGNQKTKKEMQWLSLFILIYRVCCNHDNKLEPPIEHKEETRCAVGLLNSQMIQNKKKHNIATWYESICKSE